MNLLSYFVPQVIFRSSSRFNKQIEVIESFGTRQLLVNGVVQTGAYTHQLFENGLKRLISWHSGTIKKILVFGIGGGDVFKQLQLAFPNARLSGVDIDPEIVRISRKYFFKDDDNVHLTVSDANNFADSYTALEGLFDLIVLDIYIGNDVPEFVTSVQFLTSIKRLLRDNGAVMLNYFSFQNQARRARVLNKRLLQMYKEVVMEPNDRNMFYFFR